MLPVLGAEKVKALTEVINEANSRLTKQLQSVDDFCSYLEFLEDLQKRQVRPTALSPLPLISSSKAEMSLWSRTRSRLCTRRSKSTTS